MEVNMKSQAETNVSCCPEFDPTLWNDKLFVWENKKFVKDSVCTFYYMPVNFSSVMKRLNKMVENAGATVPEWLCLSDHTSKWNMDIYLAVDKEIQDAENTTIHGKFYCKVYEGPFKNTGNWCKDFENSLKSKGYTAGKMFMWYTTCPKCAKKYGKNYVAILGQLD
jgi:hypothetical protein